MAAPAEATLTNLNGQWVMNKALGGDSDSLMALQGIGWLVRKTIGLATITLTIKQYVDEKGVTQIDIDQTLTGGFKGTAEHRELDWVEREHEDHVFGKVKGKSRFVKLEELDDQFLTSGWLPETQQSDFIQSYVENSQQGWSADQVWGFEQIEGQRRYVRHVVVIKGKTRKEAKLVYDFIGKT